MQEPVLFTSPSATQGRFAFVLFCFVLFCFFFFFVVVVVV